jgi:hypothetical protein
MKTIYLITNNSEKFYYNQITIKKTLFVASPRKFRTSHGKINFALERAKI